MKIGVVVDNQLPSDGGGFTFQSMIIGALKTINSRHDFIVLDRSASANYCRSDGIQVIGIKPRHKKYRRYRDVLWWLNIAPVLLRGLQASLAKLTPLFLGPNLDTPLARAVKELKFEVVWFISPYAELVSCPIFVTVWDLQHRLQPWFPEVSQTGWVWQMREDLYARILPRATRIITGTVAGKNEIIHFYRVPPDNVSVIPLPHPKLPDEIDEKHVLMAKKKYGIKDDYYIYPAQLWPHKNHVNLLYALAIVKSRSTSAPDLILTGSDKGNRGYIEDQTRKLGVDKYVRYLGFIPQNDLFHLYQGAIAMVFPTFFGPDNLPPLEAFANGCPVIASRVCGSEDQLGDAVLMVDPTKPEEIAQAMLAVFQDESLRCELQKKGYHRAAQCTSSDYIAQVCNLLDEFESVRRCWQWGYVEI